MCQTTLSKPLSLLIISFCLVLLLAACQQGTSPVQSNELTIVVDMSETPATPVKEKQPRPENTSISTQTPTIAVMSTTMLPPQPMPSATLVPAMTATRLPFSGQLVFSSRRQDTNTDGVIDEKDGTNLYSLDVSTGQIIQLTSGNHQDLYPAWSPGGGQIAFVSNREGNYELYVMNADGSEVKRLTNTLEDEETPKWSPDGTRIVCVLVKTLDSGLQEKRLHLISASGEDMQQLTNGPGNDDAPDWSPDGRYLAFARAEEFSEADGSTYRVKVVYLLDMQEDQFFQLTPSAKESGRGRFDDPQWLPRDGYFLSMIQVPGDVSSIGIKVFELLWEDGQPNLYRVFSIADAYGPHVWGPNGEWLISIVSNALYYGTVPNEALNDLNLLPVDFSTQRRALTAEPAAKSSHGYSLNEGELSLPMTPSMITIQIGHPDEFSIAATYLGRCK